jgi:XTP/dITP diphosphohydrolase
MKIVFASHNAGKTEELKTLLEPLDIQLIPQSFLNISEVPETGLTFIENALLKARHASLHTGLPAIADDSGLEVPALQGAPGLHSARYAGKPSNAQNNIKKLLQSLENYNDDDRVAYFYCVLVFLKHPTDPRPLISEGLWKGVITREPIGENGFGYDPIFFDPNENQSAAQLSLAKKNQISHRAQALQCLIKQLKKAELCLH